MTAPLSQKPRLPRDVLEATRDLVLEYGVEDLVRETGTARGTIYNKINPDPSPENFNKPTLADAVLWSVLAQRRGISDPARILHAFARTLNHVALPVPDLSMVSDTALLELLLRVGKEGGDFHRELSNALGNGRFEASEMPGIERAAYEWIAAILESVGRIKGLVDG